MDQPHKTVKKHWKNSSAVADELFECVWQFCGVGAWSGNNIDRIIFLTVNKNSIVFYIAWNKYSFLFFRKDCQLSGYHRNQSATGYHLRRVMCKDFLILQKIELLKCFTYFMWNLTHFMLLISSYPLKIS